MTNKSNMLTVHNLGIFCTFFLLFLLKCFYRSRFITNYWCHSFLTKLKRKYYYKERGPGEGATEKECGCLIPTSRGAGFQCYHRNVRQVWWGNQSQYCGVVGENEKERKTEREGESY